MSTQASVLFSPLKVVKLQDHPGISEACIQQVMFDHPSLLGLGKIYGRDKERVQPSGGRLDLLFQEEDGNTRYEVEVQLGATDETHIIRTIEYWDLERKRYPQYEHVAVIVAEEITARFFNVISLFNSNIPLIALKMTAIENPDGTLGLMFTKVLDLATTAFDDEDATAELTDLSYWEKNSSKEVLKIVDSIFARVKAFEPNATLSYNKFYLGIWINGKPNNFVVFRLRRRYFQAEIKLERTPETDELVEQSVFEEVSYKDRRYKFRVDSQTSEEGFEFLSSLLEKSYKANA